MYCSKTNTDWFRYQKITKQWYYNIRCKHKKYYIASKCWLSKSQHTFPIFPQLPIALFCRCTTINVSFVGVDEGVYTFITVIIYLIELDI
uniref:Uncharacterized protein n=1 Tax=Pyxicephalus adspersus TaxID=30357 RepID=A0AAV3ANJ6_PYXAD|nr:TPA: hypothetical protein GDO54_000739 [Pyxicephalus adspersus]